MGYTYELLRLHISTSHILQIYTSKPLPLAATAALARCLCALASLLLHVEHQAQHVETELRMLQAQPLELLLGLVSEHVAPRRPESSHRLPDSLVLGRSLLVHKASVRDLALGCGLGEVNLLVCDACEHWQAEALGEGVDASVAKQGDTPVIWAGDARVILHGVTADGREVVALVDVLKDSGASVDVIVGKFDTARCAGREALDFALEERCLHEQALVSGEGGLLVARANGKLNDRRTQVAEERYQSCA